jgi:hypothetical protein
MTTLLTFEEFEQLPDEPGKMELLDGELIRFPPAKLKLMKLVHQLYGLLGPIVETAGLGEVFMETGYKFGKRAWLQPDVRDDFDGQHRGSLDIIVRRLIGMRYA